MADRVAGRPFYADLFGWTFAETLKYETPSPYTVFKAGEVSAGGGSQIERNWGLSPRWLLFFAIDDYDGVVRRAEELGGEQVFNREVPETGRLSLLADPSEALFNVMHRKVIAT